MHLGIDTVALLFGVAIVASCVDAIAGGGGLIVLPTMLMVGIPPAAALATNKLQGSGGTLVASLYFLRKQIVRLRDIKLTVLMTFVGAVLGVWLVLQIDSTVLKAIIPFLLISMGAYFALSPKLGTTDQKQRLAHGPFAIFIAPLLGFYDGFFGPGAGMFMALSLVSLRGYNLTKATAQTKLLNCTSNVSSLLYFLAFGEVYWRVGLIMLAGQVIGASIGARIVLAKGAALIRPVVATVCFLMASKLLVDILRQSP
ncbi:TSUP family transporter [Leptolyngbya cf. ectocarpi LEGE 11479]|uniref:Probable membrane transporter protein n=1 Tax=Leptolyngbya cf. ectocarpi LEGE 11479 TaxID=1828722 RepID=A0A928X5H1_LEPEC|nr:TSUP family transporter [Leptolyngbya ectocarpi]MBE9067253.1 TSUP family transporter [Leptolyngbya cf. ectocarpi LEGE 11479]